MKPGEVDVRFPDQIIVRDAQPVAPRDQDRLPEAEHHDERRGDHVHRDPVHRRDLVMEEVGPRPQLVEEGQGDRQVGVDVEPEPGLVAQASAGRPERGDRDHQEQREADERPQDEPVRGEQGDDLVDDPGGVADRVADDRGGDVDADQPDRGEAEPAMGPHQAVHPERLVQPRAPAHEHELDERQVGPHERRDLADRRERAAEGRELVQRAVAQPH